tara:strand:- start:996 stop:1673 length:678 start_codon:yes stop_codon:yes gene_type:complete
MPSMTTEMWPFKVTRMDAEKGRTTFQWVKATVEREFNGQYGYGLKFEEDADGNIWNLQGEWNETTNRPDPYTGDGFRQGEVVNVQLVHRTYTRKDGSQGEGRNINKIRKAEGEPTAATEAPEETGAAPATTRSTTDQRIAKAQALNLLIQIKGQGAVEEVLGITPEAANQIVKDELLRLAKGEEVDGSTLVALLDTQEQEPEEETPAEEPSSDEPKEDVEQLSWD